MGHRRQFQRGHGGVLGRLDHGRVAGCERGSELVGQELQGRVPRRDQRRHTDRLADRVVEAVRGVQRDRLAEQLVRVPREEPVVARGEARLPLGLPQQLAVVGGFQGPQVVRPGIDQVREAVQELGPFHSGCP